MNLAPIIILQLHQTVTLLKASQDSFHKRATRHQASTTTKTRTQASTSISSTPTNNSSPSITLRVIKWIAANFYSKWSDLRTRWLGTFWRHQDFRVLRTMNGTCSGVHAPANHTSMRVWMSTRRLTISLRAMKLREKIVFASTLWGCKRSLAKDHSTSFLTLISCQMNSEISTIITKSWNNMSPRKMFGLSNQQTHARVKVYI